MTLLMLMLGFVCLVAGGELLVRGAVAIARRFGVSPLMIGLTLVGFGTSVPELVTSLQAALSDAPGISVGNVVGSNICNILLVLGTAALLRPVAASPAAFGRDGSMLVAATLVCLWVVLSGEIGRAIGAVFVISLVGYIVLTWLDERGGTPDPDDPHAVGSADVAPLRGGIAVETAVFLVGAGLTVLGARFLVDAAIDLSRAFGVSEAVIGLTVVAIGTSLPELVTSVVAALRRHDDVAFGNILGSNLFNIFGILGVTALVTPIEIPAEIARQDIWVMVAATALLLVVTVTGWRITRREGALMLGGYGAYLAFLVANV